MLPRIKKALHERLKQIYPTRYKPMCPPAYAALINTADLKMTGITDAAPEKALVAYVPADYAPFLEDLARLQPEVRIHPDAGLTSQRAYLSWSLPATPGNLPLTLWMDLLEVAKTLGEDVAFSQTKAVALVLVAADSVVITSLTPDAPLRQAILCATADCKHPPTGFTLAEMQKAKAKALAYSELPWFLMRYELKNGGLRLSVNLVPVRKLRNSQKSAATN